jgi:PLP dependent protein
MAINKIGWKKLVQELGGKAILVAVSKMQPVSSIQALYDEGQRDFGENYVQELISKQPVLPNDIRWHFIGHLQSNKVKYLAPFVHLIHGIDRFKLLFEIEKEAKRHNRIIDCLLQVHIAKDETKFGLSERELDQLLGDLAAADNALTNVRIRGLMGMASLTDNEAQVQAEFKWLATLYEKYKAHPNPLVQMDTLSMGMSGDYRLALKEGSNMVRIGSLIFGAREKTI